MAVEAYNSDTVEFDGCSLGAPALITLYDPDGPTASGSMTTQEPPAEGQTGRLVFRGVRGDEVWSVICPGIRVVNKTALGCEFTLASAPQRSIIKELDEARGAHKRAFGEPLEIR